MRDMAGMLLGLHILAGFTALFVAPGAMLARKGGTWHRRWGRIYFWAMALVALTAVSLSLFRPNLFLSLLAVFSFYLAFSGYRILYRKHPQKGDRATALDWFAAFLAGSGSASLILYGLLTLSSNSIAIVAIVFGFFGGLQVFQEVRSFVHPPADKNAWRFSHMGSMLGAYIATVSAFSVVNLGFLAPVIRWLWPTVIGVPLILIWTRYYRNKYSPKGQQAQIAG